MQVDSSSSVRPVRNSRRLRTLMCLSPTAICWKASKVKEQLPNRECDPAFHRSNLPATSSRRAGPRYCAPSPPWRTRLVAPKRRPLRANHNRRPAPSGRKGKVNLWRQHQVLVFAWQTSRVSPRNTVLSCAAGLLPKSSCTMAISTPLRSPPPSGQASRRRAPVRPPTELQRKPSTERQSPGDPRARTAPRASP